MSTSMASPYKSLYIWIKHISSDISHTKYSSDEVDKLNQELKDMRDSLAEKSKKLTERTEGAAKYDGFSFWVKIKCGTNTVLLQINAGSNFCDFPSEPL